nr:ArgP/LysG family DNA-binding transcriptional regulator [Acidobacteriota bacterium]
RATFDLHRDDEQFSTDLLHSGAVMAAVTASPIPVQGCRVERLGTMRYLAVATEEFAERWRDRTGKSLDWLAAAPRVDFDRKDTYQESFLAKLLPDSTTPRVGHFIPASTQFADAVRLSLGWSLLPEAQCRADLRSGHLVELAPKLPHDVDLHWQRWSIPSPILDTVSAVVGATAAKFLR